MAKIILCQGIQGSGKSTWAKAWANEDPEHRVRWNNDDIRNMLGKYWVTSREPIVTCFRKTFLNEAMNKGYDCVIDDMNLNPKTIQFYKGFVEDFNALMKQNHYQIEFKQFNTPLEICIERDSKREHPIGADVITETYNRYKDILKSWNESNKNN